MATHINNYPKLHNAAWPGLVGKGPDSEPPIDLDTMLDLTAKAEVDGQKFDGIDLFLFDPHVSIDIDDDGIKALADKVRSRNLTIGSVVAPVWPPTGGGSAMGTDAERKQFVTQVSKAVRIAKKLRELGVRPYGVIRIDSAAAPGGLVRRPGGEPEEDRPNLARGGRCRRGRRRTARSRRGDLLGRHALLAANGATAGDGESPKGRRLPGRHGPHAALHDGLQRPGGCDPSGELRLEGPEQA
jgi:hypothetical protein